MIFARTLEIPAVTGATGLLALARNGEKAIVDGATGTLYLSPDDGLTREFEQAQHRHEVAVEHLDALRERPAETLDGRRIKLSANAGLLADLRLVDKHGAEGVGLFRTELLALAHRGFPSEEEQQQLYQRVVEFLEPRTVTIRTLDLGGDKGIPNIGLDDEENPQLGCRSIRLTLENPRAFRAQLRAILRASTLGNVRLLLPMIGSLHELRAAKAVIDQVRRELEAEGSPFDHALQIGIMIEVPSAALTAERARGGVRFLQHRHQRPDPVHARRRPRQRARRASLRRAASGGAPADPHDGAGGERRRDPGLGLRRDGDAIRSRCRS